MIVIFTFPILLLLVPSAFEAISASAKFSRLFLFYILSLPLGEYEGILNLSFFQIRWI